MIATHEVKIGKITHKLKLSTRAIVRVEDAAGQTFFEVIGARIAGDPEGETRQATRTKTYVDILAATLGDGAGGTEDQAYDLIDAIGLVKAIELVQKLIADAFGEEAIGDDADGAGDDAGNVVAAA